MEEQLQTFVKLLKNNNQQFSKEVLDFIRSWDILENADYLNEKKNLNNQEAVKVLSEISNVLLRNGINFTNSDYNYIKDLEFKKIPPIQRFKMLNTYFDIFSQTIKESTHITDEKITSDELRELVIEYLISNDERDTYLLADKLKDCYIKIVPKLPDEDWYELNIYINKKDVEFLNKHKDLVVNFFKKKGPEYVKPLEKIVYTPGLDNCFINIAYDPNGEIQKKVNNLKEVLHKINYLSAREVNFAIELGKQEQLLASLRLLLILSEEILNEVYLAFDNDIDKLNKISFKKKLNELESKGLVIDSHAFYDICELRNIFVHAMSKHNDQSSLIYNFSEVIQFIRDIILFKARISN